MRRNILAGAAFAGILAALSAVEGIWTQSFARPQDVYDSLKTFSDVLTLVEGNFVNEIEPRVLIQNAIQGMVSRLDPHSAYMPPDLYREMQVETKGSFGGLGIEITLKDDVLTVVAPIEDSPAFVAGIKTGDKIVKVDNELTKNMTLVDAVKKMRGKPGTQLQLSIMRDGFKEPKSMLLKRDIIKIKSVKYKKLDDRYACIRIAQFQETAAEEFKKAVKALRADMPQFKGLVLDLRGNPGGLLDQAVKISDEFIDSGLIVSTEGRSDSQKMEFQAKADQNTLSFPLIVLVNSGSASASEIVAGALQDHNKAIIVGTQTFGKGTVQTIYPLGDGSGLRITTAKYFTPNHRSIQEKGITPDITVEDTLPAFSLSDKSNKAYREKDLMTHFKNGGTESDLDEEPERLPEKLKQSQGQAATDVDKPMDTALNVLKNWDTFKKSLGKEG